jgi:DnaJ-class molecular chaperone
MLKLPTFTKYFSLIAKPRAFFSSFSDPYFILGVDKNAAFPEIKKAFYKLANEFHPDKNNSQVRYHTFRSKLNRNSLS